MAQTPFRTSLWLSTTMPNAQASMPEGHPTLDAH